MTELDRTPELNMTYVIAECVTGKRRVHYKETSSIPGHGTRCVRITEEYALAFVVCITRFSTTGHIWNSDVFRVNKANRNFDALKAKFETLYVSK